MHQDLKHRLLAWKNNVHPGEIRKVFISGSPFTEGEDIVRLEMSLSNSLTGKTSILTTTSKFLTTAHPMHDIDHLNSVITTLEKDFSARYLQIFREATEEQLLRMTQLN